MKCPKCGTEFNVFPCPTCERNRLLADQNRKIEEQNRLTEQQNKEAERTRYANDERLRKAEQERQFERNEEFKAQRRNELTDKFNSRLEELITFAKERNLTGYFVHSGVEDFSVIKDSDSVENDVEELLQRSKNLIKQIKSQNILNVLEDESFLVDEMEEVIKEKCFIKFNEFVNYLKSEDRVLDASEFELDLNPKLKIGDIKLSLKNQNSGYGIINSDDSKGIFPMNILSKSSITGYDGKKIKVGSCRYLMFLKDNNEAEKVAKILSASTNYYETAKEKSKDIASNTASDFKKTNTMPVQYKAKHINLPSESKNIVSRILSVLPGIFSFYFVRMFIDFIEIGNSLVIGLIISIALSIISIFSYTVAGVSMGLLGFSGSFWFCQEYFDLGWVSFIIGIVVAFVLGILFPSILKKVDSKHHENKKEKIKKNNEKEKEMENESTENLKKWKNELINTVKLNMSKYLNDLIKN